MGRTIWYELHSPEITWERRQELRAAEAIMNLRCTWTCENFGFHFLDEAERADYRTNHRGDPVPRAWGFTKVAGDELNAMQIVATLQWVTTRFDDVLFRVHDEGDLVRCGYVSITRGQLTPDEGRIARQREYLLEKNLDEYVPKLDASLNDAKTGRFFSDVFAWDYRDRKEIVALGLSDEELRSLTVSDAVKRLRIPWFDTNSGAA